MKYQVKSTAKSSSARSMLATLMALVVVSPVAAAAQPSDSELLDRIERDWRRRQQALDSVRYVVVGRRTIPKHAMTLYLREFGGRNRGDLTASEDRHDDVSLTLLLDFKNGRSRKERLRPVLEGLRSELASDFAVFLWNGQHAQKYVPRKPGDPPFKIQLRVLDVERSVFFEPMDYPVLFAHGVFPPTNPLLLKSEIDVRQWCVTDRREIDGRPHAIIRTGRLPSASAQYAEYYEMWVDLQRCGAITRWARVSNGITSISFDAQYEETVAGWLPVKWIYIGYLPDGGHAREIHDMTVRRTDLNPHVDDDLFEMEPTKGMVVQNLNEERAYVSGGAEGKDVDFATAFQTDGVTARRSTRLLAMLASGAFAIIFVVAALTIWQRRRP